MPVVSRKTDKGLPTYGDGDAQETDVFILSGAEDLVPELVFDGFKWILPQSIEAQDAGEVFAVRRYRPRIEGLFSRIEKWTNKKTLDIHWRSWTKDNVVSIYGRGFAARVADPSNARHVFEWLIEETRDDRGNRTVFDYKHENSDRIDPTLPQEKTRLSAPGFAQTYLKHVYYGNRTPNGSDWLFTVLFDYGEHDADQPSDQQVRKWPVRSDPFSTFRPTFEVRTYRLCRRVVVFHTFADDLGADPIAVRSLDFRYDENPISSLLIATTQTGYLKRGGAYQGRSLPPTEFGYTQAVIDDAFHSADRDALENLPAGADETIFHWVDLDGEGAPGLLSEQEGAWFYKRNLGAGRLGPLEVLSAKPAPGLGGQRQLMNVTGTGRPDLVQLGGPLAGYYARTDDADWEPFAPFVAQPQIAWNDPNLRFVDLDGDGRSDVLITEDEVFRWYPSLGPDGFDAPRLADKPHDEERGPALVLSDAEQALYLADMTGDGLSDLVRIRNGEVCYWPNKGYGSFGPKVVMDSAPVFDFPDVFDQKRVRLADVDGSGTADLVYLGRDFATIWSNQSGNSWGAPRRVALPPIDRLSTVEVTDLLASGTACLVWSSPLPDDQGRQLQYVDLTGGVKPNLLRCVKNNLGRETWIDYASSTQLYLEDRAAGKPWITNLAFPVHVVIRVENRDAVTGEKLVSTYRYRHGFYDAVEREFRGFGYVEHLDMESLEALAVPKALDLPPVLTKTWLHTGVYLGRANVLRQMADEYFQGDVDPSAAALPDALMPDGLTVAEEREAARALKGQALRQEVYGLDGTGNSAVPYSVVENTYLIKPIQPMAGNRHAVFLTHAADTVTFHYERDASDPRVTHDLVLGVDPWGNVTQAANVAYARRGSPADDEQKRVWITFTENDVINKTDEAGWFRVGIPTETRVWELTGVTRSGALYAADELTTNGFAKAVEIPNEQDGSGGFFKRLIKRSRTLYLKNDLVAIQAAGACGESLAIPYQHYEMAFTPGLLSSVYANRGVTDDILRGEGGYVKGKDLKDQKLFPLNDADDVWWAPSGTVLYDPATAANHFYLPKGFQDPFGKQSFVTFDGYDLLPIQTKDALQNQIDAKNDYRVLASWQVTDVNGNRVQTSFDALGMAVGSAVMGKDGGPVEGDSLATFTAELDETVIAARMQDPLTDPWSILGTATQRFVYDVNAFLRSKTTGQDGRDQGPPVAVYTLSRETHEADLAAGSKTKVQHRFAYSDGFGRALQIKAQAEPLTADGQPSTPRWVGSGWTILNNKGAAVKKFDPFFSATHAFEFAQIVGVSSTLFYDPLGRVVATLHPDHTYEKMVFDPWTQTISDANDNVLVSNPATDDPDVAPLLKLLDSADYLKSWYGQRIDGSMGDDEKDAASKAAHHAGTPAVTKFDTLGRVFSSIADNGAAGKYEIRKASDIQGRQLVVTDALGRQALTGVFDMLGRRVQSHSIDAGDHWSLFDLQGRSIRGWDGPAGDARTNVLRTTYDELRRPFQLFVTEGPATERMAEKNVYGELIAGANLKSRVYQSYDGAGVATNDAGFDFKGNPLGAKRELLQDYTLKVNWANPQKLQDSFIHRVTYDALNRPMTMTSPDKSVIVPAYNEANLLERLSVGLRGAVPSPFITNIDYDAKGQRMLVEYQNGAKTTFGYDQLTFRLKTLQTTSHGEDLQDLTYTYDPVGNITRLRDAVPPTVYFDNAKVDASADYTYDAIYRLTTAQGRESIGLSAQPQYDWDDLIRQFYPPPGDGKALRSYTENYTYDNVGNITLMDHFGVWKRRYEYVAGTNRLNSTSMPGDPDDVPLPKRYDYDLHGSMTLMPHLPTADWTFKNELRAATVGTDTTYFTYDAQGQRVRKVHEVAGTGLIKERVYLGGFEVYREIRMGVVQLRRETVHVMDDTRRVALIDTLTHDGGKDIAPGALQPLTRCQFDNHLASSCLELDDSGNVITYEEFYPYGATSYQIGRTQAEVGLKRYRYTAKERDRETGLCYHGARYYAPWLGRWTSPDPATIAGLGDINAYSYVSGHCIRQIDPSGMAGEEVVTIFHATTERVAKALNGTIPRVDVSKFYAWAGTGFYGSSSKTIGGYGDLLAAGKDTVVATEISTEHMLTLSGKEAKAFQELEAGLDLRRVLRDSFGVEAKTADPATLARYFDDIWKKFHPDKQVIRWEVEGQQGVYHYLVRSQGAFRSPARYIGKLKTLIKQAKAAAKAAKAKAAKKAAADSATHSGADAASHGAADTATHGAADTASHGVADTASHGIADTASHGVADTASHGIADTASHGVADAATHGLADTATHGSAAAAKGVGGKILKKAIPFVGIAFGVGFVTNDLRKGEYVDAAWDTAEAIPVVGDFVLILHYGFGESAAY